MACKLPILPLPDKMPASDVLRSHKDNKHGYDPEFWEFRYEIYRYLSRVEKDELSRRYEDILLNLKRLNAPDRHIIPIQTFLSSWYWFRKEHQTRLEFHMRKLDLPLEPPWGLLEYVIENPPARPKHPNYGDVLFRYGAAQHMQELVDQGRIRLAPAAFYLELEGDASRFDDERQKHSFLAGEYTHITTSDGREQQFRGDLRRTVSAPNYYTLCVSTEFDPAHFADFDAEACVVITDTDAFADRIGRAAQEHLPDWNFHHCPVEYFDPHEMIKNQLFNAVMSKDFRFAYQREYRFVWMDIDGKEAKDEIFLNLGPLADVCEIVFR